MNYELCIMEVKRALSLLAASAVGAVAMAVPAKPGLVAYTQPDGTVVNVRLVGDEHGHVVYSESGLLLVDADGELQYAKFDAAGAPVASGIAAAQGNEHLAMTFQTSAEREQWAARVDDDRATRVSQYRATMAGQARAKAAAPAGEEAGEGAVPFQFGRIPSSFPVLGEQKGLVVLVQYQDEAFEYGDYDYFQRALNQEGFSDNGALGSARDWFIENSDGRFIPQFDVFGPVTLPNDRLYYGKNTGFGRDEKAYEMVIHACQMLDDEIDFTQYDRDGDDFLDNVFVFYAGAGEHESGIASTVWPHSWDIVDACPGEKFIFDGVRLNHYACTSEYLKRFDRVDGIGTFVHEFSHVMGLPDLYCTAMGSPFTPGPWSVLDSGPYNNDGVTPANYSAFEKCALGWLDFKPLPEGIVELPDLSTSNEAYYLPTDNPNEFFFFENRQQVGNDAFLPGHGMLIWHVAYDEYKWFNNTVNNGTSKQGVDIVEADNKKTADTRDGDPFPGTANVTSFTYNTLPRLISWNRKRPALDIEEIAETEEGLITFKAVAHSEDTAVGEAAVEESTSAPCYDLMGRPVTNPAAGIYIRDGKKLIIH